MENILFCTSKTVTGMAAGMCNVYARHKKNRGAKTVVSSNKAKMHENKAKTRVAFNLGSNIVPVFRFVVYDRFGK